MNLPNLLTIIRILLTPVFMFFLYRDSANAHYIALVLFIIAGATDGFDGYIARKKNQVTNFGKFIDPLADKILTTAAFLAFVDHGKMAAAAALIIIAREFAITSLRVVAIAEGVPIAASVWGKIKTIVQMLCIVVMILNTGNYMIVPSVSLDALVVWIMVGITVISGIDYIAKNWKLIVKDIK